MAVHAQSPFRIRTDDDRRRDLATTLATGLLRWARRCKATSPSPAEPTCPQDEPPLDLSANLPLSVSPPTAGFAARELGEHG